MQTWLETYNKNTNWMEWGLSRAEILHISHDAMGQNCATWLISRSCLSKMSYICPARSLGFHQNQLNVIEGEELFYDNFVLD